MFASADTRQILSAWLVTLKLMATALSGCDDASVPAEWMIP
jgi:hypothetical protein